MSAFVELCFGDFTQEETQDFLDGTLSADLTATVKVVCKEVIQSPEGSQSEKDAASLSNHTEGEPTSSEPVVFLNQPKKKVKKKIKKRRKSNTQLSGRSSSSEDFSAPLIVEFDINSPEIKDDESEDRCGASPSSSPVDEVVNPDGTVSTVAACVQQLPWSNLNKKSRSRCSSSSESNQEEKARRRGSCQGSYRVQDASKKWNEQNNSDGGDAELSDSSSDSSSEKKALDNGVGIHNKQDENSTNQADEDVDGNVCTKTQDMKTKERTADPTQQSTSETQNDSLPVKEQVVAAPPPAPKRWADLFTKPPVIKQEITGVATPKPAPQSPVAVPPVRGSGQGKKASKPVRERPRSGSKPLPGQGEPGQGKDVIPSRPGPQEPVVVQNAMPQRKTSGRGRNRERERPRSGSNSLPGRGGEKMSTKPDSQQPVAVPPVVQQRRGSGQGNNHASKPDSEQPRSGSNSLPRQGGEKVSPKPVSPQPAAVPPVVQQQRGSGQGNNHVSKPNSEQPCSGSNSLPGQGGEKVSTKPVSQQPAAVTPVVQQQRGSGQGNNHSSKPDSEPPHSGHTAQPSQSRKEASSVTNSEGTFSQTQSRSHKTGQVKNTERNGLSAQKVTQSDAVGKANIGNSPDAKAENEEGTLVASCTSEPILNGVMEKNTVDVQGRRFKAVKNGSKQRVQHKTEQPAGNNGQRQSSPDNGDAAKKENQKPNNKPQEKMVDKTLEMEGNVVIAKKGQEPKAVEKSQHSQDQHTEAEKSTHKLEMNGTKEKNISAECADEEPIQFLNEDEVNETHAPVLLANGEPNKGKTASESQHEEKKLEIKEQAKAEVIKPVSQTPWQNPKRWSDLFSKPKSQGGEATTKKQPEFKAVNGLEKTVGVKATKKPQKNLSLEEEQKLELALDVAEIIRKCKLKTLTHEIPRPRGLINTSNWCYVNSTLQALIACPQLVMCLRALIPVVDRLKVLAPYSGAIVELLKEFPYLEGDLHVPRQKMFQLLAVKGDPFEPHGVYRALEQLNHHLTMAKDHHQHDAEEYLTTSLGRIDHELMDLLKIASDASDDVEMTEEDENEQIQNGGIWQEVYKKNKSTVTRRIVANDTPITQIFGGDFRSYVYRNDKLDSSMVEPFLTLSLSVDGGVMCIEEALRKDLGQEDIGDEGSVTKKLLFERLPKVMIIQLKKFSYDSSNGCIKLKKNLAFYDELVIDKDLMSPFVSAQYSSENDRTYKLSAVLYHAGRNAHCGHYITAAKYTQQWLLFDDNIVRQIALKRVLQPEGKEPYILFYSRI